MTYYIMRVAVWIYDKHVHLSQKDAEILFGKDFELNKVKELSQPWQFIAKETITLKWPKGEVKNVEIFGPWRKQTQIELLNSNCVQLGIDAPIRLSGDLKNSAKITLIGPKGTLELKEGAIIAKRHLHMTVAESEEFWLKNGQSVKIKIKNKERWLIFDNVIVRVRDNFSLDCHIDLEEGNSAGIGAGAWGEIVI